MTPDLRQKLNDALSKDGGASSDFDLNPDIRLPRAPELTPAAVLVAIHAETGRMILTKRSPKLQHHPGQIAFAGGKMDSGDADLNATALREAHEEIGLDPTQVELLGQLPSHRTVTNFTMTPVIGLVHGVFAPTAEIGEVSEVFEVPLSHVINPSNFVVQSRRWQGRQRRFYTVPYGPYYIWGATARILRALADRIRP